MDTNGLFQHAPTGRTIAITTPHWTTITSPVTAVTIEHTLPRRYVEVMLISPDHYRLPEGIISSIYYGQHSPVVTNEFYVEITFNDPFTGTIRLDF